MRNRRTLSLVFSIALCLIVQIAMVLFEGVNVTNAQTTVRYVATTGFDNGQCADPSSPCRTVQYAVDTATEGDIVQVALGVYTDVSEYSGITQTVYIDKSVTIRGGYAADFSVSDPTAFTTTLDAGGKGRVLYITGSNTVAIEGLSITGGEAQWVGPEWEWVRGVGGGLFVISATLTMNRCQVFSNTARFVGGGAFARAADFTAIESAIIDNEAGSDGGGLHTEDSIVAIRMCDVVRNQSWGSGGGVSLVGGDASVLGNTILDNQATHGGGLHVQSSHATVAGNSILANKATLGGGGAYLTGRGASLRGNIFSSNLSNCNYSTDGGGALFLVGSDARVEENIIMSNEACDAGGAMYLNGSNPTVISNVFFDNQSSVGNAIYVYGSDLLSLHNTFAENDNGSSDWYYNNAVYMAWSSWRSSVLTLTNTIFASHTLAVFVDFGNTVYADSTLWHNNGGKIYGSYATISQNNDCLGDPLFESVTTGDLHIGNGSAALDLGVDAGVTTDLDHQPRPNKAPDLGADEYWPPGALHDLYLPISLQNAL